ncbi:MAG: hypothetical protein ACR2PZ_12440 [Pseudomonadales bacterium]
MRFALTILLTLALGGCGDTNVVNVRLGDVSLGQQLIDLQTALDSGAIDQAEYAAAKETILLITEACMEQEDGNRAE